MYASVYAAMWVGTWVCGSYIGTLCVHVFAGCMLFGSWVCCCRCVRVRGFYICVCMCWFCVDVLRFCVGRGGALVFAWLLRFCDLCLMFVRWARVEVACGFYDVVVSDRFGGFGVFIFALFILVFVGLLDVAWKDLLVD